MLSLLAALALNVDGGLLDELLPARRQRMQESLRVLAGQPPEPVDPEAGFLELFDDPTIDVVKRAKRIEVIRLFSIDDRTSEPSLKGYMTAHSTAPGNSVDGYQVASRATVDGALAERIRAVVLAHTSYLQVRGMKLCGGFQPKVVFRFASKSAEVGPVDVLLCFNCGDVGVLGPKQRHGGTWTIDTADMGRAEESWLELAKAALPNDEFIQNTHAH